MKNSEVFSEELQARLGRFLAERGYKLSVSFQESPAEIVEIYLHYVEDSWDISPDIVQTIPGKRVQMYPYDAASLAEISLRKAVENVGDSGVK